MGKLHVLFLSSWYPSSLFPTDGIFVKRHAKAVSHYCKVSVIHVCSDETISEIKIEKSMDDGIFTLIAYYPKVKTGIPFIKQLKQSRLYLSAFKKAFEILKENAGMPVIAHLNVVFPAGLLAFHLKSKYNIPFITTEHWTGYLPSDNNYKGASLKRITSKIIAQSSHITTVSKDLRDAMLSHNLKGDYSVVPNVVDTNAFMPSTGEQLQTTKFIHISTLDERQKNISGLLRAFHSAFLQNKNIQLTIIDDGTEANRKQAEKQANELGLLNQSVFFLGQKTPSEIVQYINASRALLMFSNYETFSCVIAEAWSCGIPVIASLSGGIENKITQDNGILISPKDEKALTNAILEMANPELTFNREVIREYAVKNFSYEVVGKNFSDIYESVISKN